MKKWIKSVFLKSGKIYFSTKISVAKSTNKFCVKVLKHICVKNFDIESISQKDGLYMFWLICIKVKSTGNLKKHKKTHSGEKIHRFKMCEYSGVSMEELIVHMMRKHTGEKPNKCNQCNYTCTRSVDLQSHMKTHTGEKPFNCNLCSKAYSFKSGLTNHFKIHMA